jgi:Protein of unknown function (DUF3810)
MLKKSPLKLIWPVLALCTVGLFMVAKKFPEATERYYSQGLYPSFRSVLDTLLGWLPIAGWYLFGIILMAIIWDWIRPFFHKDQTVGTRWRVFGQRFINSISILVIVFYWFWGFNYARPRVETKHQLTTQELSPTVLRQHLDSLKPALMQARLLLPTGPITGDGETFISEKQARTLVNKALDMLDYAPVNKARVRSVGPSGLLMRLGASGVYLPWVGQAQYDKALHPLQKPSVALHELGHAAGLADEAACDFVGMLAAATSTDAIVRYSGLLAEWRLAASRYKAYEAANYDALRLTLPQDIQNDLNEINAVYKAHPSFFGTAAYDQYLKWQGTGEGIERYASAIGLLRAWRAK